MRASRPRAQDGVAGRRRRAAVALALACAFGAGGQAVFAQGKSSDGDGRALVLTVMPFRTHAEPAYAYLGEGFSEALTTKLVGLRRVRLFERSQFDRLASELKLERDSGGLFDASTLARAGAVVSIDYALLGSVSQSGGSVACNVRLVHVNSGRVALAREFRGAYPKELFALQDAAALAVAEALAIRMDDLELKRLVARPTEDVDAYGLYNRSLASADQAERVKLLEAAVARDPSFAMAQHLLADAYLAIGRPERAEAAYGRIVALDPSDHRAAYNLALLRLDACDYAEARELLDRCVELKPGDADALYHIGFSYEFSATGERYGPGSDIEAALSAYRQAMTLDERHAEAALAGGTLCAVLAQAEEDAARRLELLREARSGLGRYLALEPEALDAEAIAATLEAIGEAVREHEEYLGTTM